MSDGTLSPDAVCFDLDGTLSVLNQSPHDIHRAVFDSAGVDPMFTPQDVRDVDAADIAPADSDEEFYTNLYRATVEHRAGQTDVDDALLRTLGEITTDVVDNTDVSFRDGARDALTYALDRYDVGLITNGGRETQRAKLEALGIDGVFDVAVFCDPTAGMPPKPARKPFETALDGLSTAAEKTVYVGNSHSTDVVGAHEVGLQSIWVPVPDPDESASPTIERDPAPTHRFDSMADLTTVL